ncbi:MAG: hypothetical protein GWP03_00010 [Proteobacteria bacterium]|nr:hypothetical protein [Pseudomonadota bacterium]
MKELLEKMISVEGVKGVVTVKSDDGSPVESVGENSSVMDDISAFVGSCGDVISKLLKLDGFNDLKFYTDDLVYLIIPKNDIYIGLQVDKQSDINMTADRIAEIIEGKAEVAQPATAPGEKPAEVEGKAEEKVTEGSVLNLSPNIKKFIKSKVLQINYLIDEFAKGGSKDDWLQNVVYSLKTMDTESKMSNALVEEENSVKLHLENVSNDISENEISDISKGIIDELCKVSVRRYGTDQTKQKIQNVIKKIAKGKVG